MHWEWEEPSPAESFRARLVYRFNVHVRSMTLDLRGSSGQRLVSCQTILRADICCFLSVLSELI